MHQRFDYVQANPPIVTDICISRQLGALSSSVPHTENNSPLVCGHEGRRGNWPMNSFDLSQHELSVKEIHRNLPPSVLYEHAIRYDKEATIAENGALVAYSGDKTGRSPKDKRIVKNPGSEKDVWWGTTNVPLDPNSHRTVRQRALDYLNVCDRLYCFDGFA